ncbi:DUF443 family protein [Bacillus aquiflavi]|uniref:DUF443 domain-containing protein n=1 Tax=Bacillus aquiflavi TaxID=2672567 RepID=A0A6B3VTD3_9BACI|nr:DUF443 family protein [Bacillus aquiflavi]MBA4537273.1 DUF443 family protein [Bacillus aquiflavi]NEY81530.1 DUF443 domain-containing protein [Bacillus aquiflavi]UAC48693.1 DUF443 domain-containing protein [Bacillus aquiflavi]
MNCEVLFVHKNIRYKIININETNYIFDQDHPFLVFFSPFLNWMKLHTVYKITDKDKIEQLAEKNNKKVGFGIAMFNRILKGWFQEDNDPK